MTRKQYRRRMEFIKGYRMGYRERGMFPGTLESKSEDFKRGYIEARRDFRSCEPPQY